MTRFITHSAAIGALGAVLCAGWAAGASDGFTRTQHAAATAALDTSASLTETSLAAVQGTVRGIVCPEDRSPGVPCNREPLPACTVGVAFADVVVNTPLSISTDALFAPLRVFRGISNDQGRYTVDSIPLSFSGQRVIVSVRAEGFETASLDTAVWSGMSSVVDLVLQPAAVTEISLDMPRKPASLGPVSYSEPDRVLSLHVERGQTVAIEAFLLNGQRDGRLNAERFFEAGTYRFSLSDNRLGNGVVIIRVRGEDFSEVKKINLGGGK